MCPPPLSQRREFGVRNSFTKISICVPLAVVVRPSLGFGSSVELVDEAETLAALEVHESRGVLYVEAAMAFLTSRVVKVTIKMPSFALRSIVKTHQGGVGWGGDGGGEWQPRGLLLGLWR